MGRVNLERAGEILSEASEAIVGERNRTHGDPLAQHQALMQLWLGYERACKLSGWQAKFMPGTTAIHRLILLKVSRAINGEFNEDDYRDLAGYSGLGSEVHKQELCSRKNEE